MNKYSKIDPKLLYGVAAGVLAGGATAVGLSKIFAGGKKKQLTNFQAEQFANLTGKINAPTFAYQTVYGKNPDKFLPGRTNEPKKTWNGISVDKGLKDEWLNKLNNLPVEIRSTDEGKSSIRPAFTVIRMPEDKDNLHEEMVKNLKKQPDLHVKSDIGMSGRPRICVAGKIWKGQKKWNNWWNELPNKINYAYNKTVKDGEK